MTTTRTDASVSHRYVGPAELLALLRIGRTRLAHLTARPDFPAPSAVVRMGSVWDLDDIHIWARSTGRTLHLEDLPDLTDDATTPGRPAPVEPVGAAELLGLLNISQTRLAVLSRQNKFPAPAIAVRMGKIWDLDDIRAWSTTTGRSLNPDT